MFQEKGREAGWLIATVCKRNIFYLHSLIPKKRSYITVSRPWTKLKVVLVETHKLEMKGSIYFSNNQCKIFHQNEYLFVCVVILHYRSNKCIQYPIWRQIQPMHCIHYIWRHWFWLANNGYIRKPRVLSYVIKNSCRKVQQYSSWEKWIGYLSILILPNVLRSSKLLREKWYSMFISHDHRILLPSAYCLSATWKKDF